ncbi:MAG: protease YdgD [Rhodobacteraceae bacterium HLUCCO18]|nr:MAG: protease YdgD [Rhodobacteraceae bacterium HLUCCO18]
MQMAGPVIALVALLAAPASADPAADPGLAPLSAEASLGAVARIRGANSIEGGCTAVLIAPDVALTAAHCARGPVSGPDAMRLTFRPDTTPPAFAVTVRAVAFHAEQRNDGLSTETAHADLALLRLAMPVPPEVAQPIPLATGQEPASGAIYGYVNGADETLRGHFSCQIAPASPQLLVSDCRVVSGFSGAPLLSGGPGDWRVEGIAVATVFGQPYRALIADVVPWPAFSGPYALQEPPSAAPQTSP